MSKLSEIFNREIDLIKKDENTLGIVLVGSSKDLDFEKDIKINDIDLFIFTKEQDENQIRINKEISSIEFDLNYISIKGCKYFIETKEKIKITYFKKDQKKSGGDYLTTIQRIKKIDSIYQTITLQNGQIIKMEDIYEIEQ